MRRRGLLAVRSRFHICRRDTMRATVRSRSTRQIGRLRVAAAGAPGNTPSITAPDHDAVNGACTRATSAVPGTAEAAAVESTKGLALRAPEVSQRAKDLTVKRSSVWHGPCISQTTKPGRPSAEPLVPGTSPKEVNDGHQMQAWPMYVRPSRQGVLQHPLHRRGRARRGAHLVRMWARHMRFARTPTCFP